MKSPGPRTISRVYKPAVHLLALAPFANLVYGFFNNALGVNPVETLTRDTGQWGLRILLLALAVTPLARLTRSGWLLRFRRMIGLYAFFYVLMHFMVYLVFDMEFDFAFLVEDVVERPYITVGFSALVILTALAATSTLAIRQRMGRNWDRLHRAVYAAGVLAVTHFLWSTKVDEAEPLVYGAILAVLLGYRLFRRSAGPGRRTASARAASSVQGA